MANPNTPSAREKLEAIRVSMRGVSHKGLLQLVLDNLWDDDLRAKIIAVQKNSRSLLLEYQQAVQELIDQQDGLVSEVNILREREEELTRSIRAKNNEYLEISEEISGLKQHRDTIRNNERKLDIRNRALERQVQELTAQRDSLRNKIEASKAESEPNTRQADEISSLQNELAQAHATIAKLEADAKSKREAHASALQDRGKTIDSLRSTIADLKASNASAEASLHAVQQELSNKREPQKKCAKQDPAPLELSTITEVEYVEMSQALLEAQSVARRATVAAENWKRLVATLSQQGSDMKQMMTEVLHLSQLSAEATQVRDDAELATVGLRIETILKTLRDMSKAKPSAQEVKMARYLTEQNAELTKRLQQAISAAGHWRGTAEALDAECERLAEHSQELENEVRKTNAILADVLHKVSLNALDELQGLEERLKRKRKKL